MCTESVLENYKVLVKKIKADPSRWRDTLNASRLLSELCPRPPPSLHGVALQVTRAPSTAITVGGHLYEAPLVLFSAPRVMCELARGPDSLFQSTLLQLINSTNTSWAPTRDCGYGRADTKLLTKDSMKKIFLKIQCLLDKRSSHDLDRDQ